MAKTTKILFVKPNDTALMIEGESLENYKLIHKHAQTALKIKQSMIETKKGRKINVQIEAFKDDLSPEDKASADRIIFINDKDEAILLDGDAFNLYQKNHFAGLKLITNKVEIKGKIVKVIIS